jgi:hypothetical protein
MWLPKHSCTKLAKVLKATAMKRGSRHNRFGKMGLAALRAPWPTEAQIGDAGQPLPLAKIEKDASATASQEDRQIEIFPYLPQPYPIRLPNRMRALPLMWIFWYVLPGLRCFVRHVCPTCLLSKIILPALTIWRLHNQMSATAWLGRSALR